MLNVPLPVVVGFGIVNKSNGQISLVKGHPARILEQVTDKIMEHEGYGYAGLKKPCLLFQNNRQT